MFCCASQCGGTQCRGPGRDQSEDRGNSERLPLSYGGLARLPQGRTLEEFPGCFAQTYTQIEGDRCGIMQNPVSGLNIDASGCTKV